MIEFQFAFCIWLKIELCYLCCEHDIVAEGVLTSMMTHVSELSVLQVSVASMASVEEVNTKLEEFMRNPQLTNERFQPIREQQDILNNKFETKIIQLEGDNVKTETGWSGRRSRWRSRWSASEASRRR